MTKDEFFALWLSEMDFYNEFTIENIRDDTPLNNFSNWDSLSRAAVQNFIEAELGVTLDVQQLRTCVTISDVMKLTGKFNE